MNNTGRRKKASKKLLRSLRGGMLVLGGMIFVVGLLLLILPLLRVKKIEVVGNHYYSEEEIIAYSELQAEEELFALDLQNAVDSINSNCRYVKETRISIRFPFTVRIQIVEKEDVMYTSFNGKYYSFDRDFNVLESGSDEGIFSDFLKVSLPAVATPVVGEKLVFSNSEVDMSYICELLDFFKSRDMMSAVTYIDYSQKYSVSYILDNVCRIEIGKVDALSQKQIFVDHILEKKGGLGAACAVIDVSNYPNPATYREISKSELIPGQG